MGNYNNLAPTLLGEQWVPIRNEDVLLPNGADTFEQGHGFTIVSPEVLDHGTFYMDTPAYSANTQIISVYPRGTEALSGPVQSVIIPVIACSVTGSTFSGSTGGVTSAAITAALASPSDSSYVISTQPATPVTTPGQLLQCRFNVNPYTELQGKRILAVNILLKASGYNNGVIPSVPLTPNASAGPGIAFVADDSLNQQGGSFSMAPSTFGTDQDSWITQPILPYGLGDTTANFVYPSASLDRMPWRFTDLQKFDPSAGVQRLSLYFLVGGSTSQAFDNIRIDYVAMQVIFCEEQRVAVGAKVFSGGYVANANPITLRTPISNASNPVLAAGDYTLMISTADAGANIGLAPMPPINAARELYTITPHPGYITSLTQTVGAQFVRTTTHVLPQLSLHSSGGTLTEPHAYGRSIGVPVYGASAQPQQVIYDDVVGVATSYPQVRWYARRYGNTTVPLTLASTNVTGSGITVSISVTDFDALPEIADGWREVTLRFPTAPTMGTVSPDPIWKWSAVGETAGNQWQILAAGAPAISGVPGNTLNTVPTRDLLGPATYQPPAGSATNLTWLAPVVSGSTADTTTDAVLIFSQDPPTPTGVTLTNLTQTVTGIGLYCGTLPCCIPSGIAYQRVTWSQTSLAASGFGAYELQRYDSVVGSFQTIMLTTSALAATGTLAFNDFEARVGIASVYRLRVLNSYNFAGAWSTQVTGTIPSPGLYAGCGGDGNSALIFTTNSAQSGSGNLAYIMNWDNNNPTEPFDLPEGGDVALLEMYGRDGVVAFHGTERGLERFSRVVLLQAGAIGLPSMANATAPRNLFWANYPYICVRDELGNRWYANVRLPQLTVQNNRQSYMAAIAVTETTQTPYAVAP